MSDKSKIEWTDATWNPVRGCDKISPGCKNCYAATFAERFRGVAGHPYEQGFDLRLVPEKLSEPLRWTQPKMIFVNSMSDLFHEDVSEQFIAAVFAVMNAAHWHRFQVLTKRPERMAALLSTVPANVWMGTSIEDDRRAVDRLPALLAVPAAVRFLSLEPLLSPLPNLALDGIHWAIVGGESGAAARACDPAWIADIISQCRRAGVACFVKQLGSVWAKSAGAGHPKGGDIEEWPAALQVREFPA
jgi:protein gp37